MNTEAIEAGDAHDCVVTDAVTAEILREARIAYTKVCPDGLNTRALEAALEAAFAYKAQGECRYCANTGHFYSEPTLGPCSCPLGKATTPIVTDTGG